ncbi:MAG: cob(I)yrinic acid a,c-diamide adenosyltransferase [Flavobacteriales bacterium]
MKIYTKKGDQGHTGLIGGTRVSKGDLRIEAYGTVDELNSYVGLIRSFDINHQSVQQLIEIQDRLFTIGSSLASDPEKSNMKIPDLLDADVEKLEDWMDQMDAQLPALTSFVLPGGHPFIGHIHVCRCVCRRTERLVVTLDEHEFVAPLVLIYLNRLSDYLFVLGRKIAMELNIQEKEWHPRY